MSIVRAAARMALTETLRGRTLVGDNVLDSLIGGIDFDADGAASLTQKAPFAAIYSDSSEVSARDFSDCGFLANGATMFVIEYGIAAAMFEPVSEDSGEVVMTGTGLVVTDSNMEFELDLLTRQIADCLIDPGNAWAQVFRDLMTDVTKIERSRTGNVDDGVRLTGQQIRITGHLLADPASDTIDAESGLGRFFTLAAASTVADVVSRASTLQGLLDGTQAGLELVQRLKSLSTDQSGALGLTPLDDETPDQAFDQATIEPPQGGTQVVNDD